MSDIVWADYQEQAFENAAKQSGVAPRLGLFYKTGAGKTFTSLEVVRRWGHDHAVVITPPLTNSSWHDSARRLGMTVEPMSHQKFQQKNVKLSRHVAVIGDEFHLFGKNTGPRFKKLDTLAYHLQAPLVVMSATPNYNDAERCYCFQHVLDPHSAKGGLLAFIYQHCITEMNPFSQTPNVVGFQHYKDAAHFLSSLPYVEYLPDDLVYTIDDIPHRTWVLPRGFEEYGYNQRTDRMMASDMETRHARINLALVEDDGTLDAQVFKEIERIVSDASTPVLIYTTHSTVGEALAQSLYRAHIKHAFIHGGTNQRNKDKYLDAFRDGVLDVLVGTASLATGTDGLDKVCDTMVILDDTDDPSLRRQLVGRIMPRGINAGPATGKSVYRIVLE